MISSLQYSTKQAETDTLKFKLTYFQNMTTHELEDILSNSNHFMSAVKELEDTERPPKRQTSAGCFPSSSLPAHPGALCRSRMLHLGDVTCSHLSTTTIEHGAWAFSQLSISPLTVCHTTHQSPFESHSLTSNGTKQELTTSSTYPDTFNERHPQSTKPSKKGFTSLIHHFYKFDRNHLTGNKLRIERHSDLVGAAFTSQLS